MLYSTVRLYSILPTTVLLGFHKLHFPPCLPAASTAPAPPFAPAKQETPPAASMPLAHHRVPQVPLQQRPRLEPVAAPARSRGNPLDAAHPSSRSAVHRARSSRSSARLEAVAHLVGMVVGMAVGRSAIPGVHAALLVAHSGKRGSR